MVLIGLTVQFVPIDWLRLTLHFLGEYASTRFTSGMTAVLYTCYRPDEEPASGHSAQEPVRSRERLGGKSRCMTDPAERVCHSPYTQKIKAVSDGFVIIKFYSSKNTHMHRHIHTPLEPCRSLGPPSLPRRCTKCPAIPTCGCSTRRHRVGSHSYPTRFPRDKAKLQGGQGGQRICSSRRNGNPSHDASEL